MTEPDAPEARETLTRLADSLDVLLAADETHLRRIAELEEYTRELEADNVRVTQGRTAAEEHAKEFAAANAALELELKGVRKTLRAADIQLEQVRAKEVEPLTEQVAQLTAQMEALRETVSVTESNAIAYRLPGDGAPDIVVRWQGGEWWAVTNGVSRYWSTDRGWLDDHGAHTHRHPECTRFTRADALTHAQTLMEAAQARIKERGAR